MPGKILKARKGRMIKRYPIRMLIRCMFDNVRRWRLFSRVQQNEIFLKLYDTTSLVYVSIT